MTQAQDKTESAGTTAPASAPTNGSGGGVSPMMGTLRGKDFKSQEAALRPGARVQMDKPADAPADAPAPAASDMPAPPADFGKLASDIQAAFATLSSLPAGDPQIPVELAKILGPLGVSVPTPAADAPKTDGPAQWLSAVSQAIASTAARLPDKIVDKPKPTTLAGTLETIQLFTTYRNKHKDQPHADEVHKPTLIILNKLYGIEQVGKAWQGNGKGGGRVASGAGLSAAAAAMAYVGTVNKSAPSGQKEKAKDGQGQESEVSTIQGAGTMWEIWQGGCDPSFIGNAGGEAAIKKHGSKLPSWCGIFATHVLNKSGGGGGKWVEGGGALGFLSWPSKSPVAMIEPIKADPVAGDIAYAQSHNQHYCIVVRVDGDTLYTVDGNSGPGGATAGGQIVAQARSKKFFSNIYQRP